MTYSIPYNNPYKETHTSAIVRLQNGVYLAELEKIFIETKHYGETISVQWRILQPDGPGGRTHWENFTIGSDLPEKQEKEKTRFNLFWSQIDPDFSGQAVSSSIDFPRVLMRRMHLKIKNYEGRDGVFRPYVVERTLVRTEPQGNMPQELPVSTTTISLVSKEEKTTFDDEIPF